MPDVLLAPLSVKELGVTPQELTTPAGVAELKKQFVENAKLGPSMDFETHFGQALKLNELGVFQEDPELKNRLVKAARAPIYLEEMFVQVDDCVKALQDPSFADQAPDITQRMKELKQVAEICQIDKPPQFTEDELSPEDQEVVLSTWRDNWPIIENNFQNYVPSDTEPTVQTVEPARAETPSQEAREVAELFEQTQQGLPDNLQTINSWLEVLGPHAQKLNAEQLTQFPPYILLRLMTDGHLKPEQIKQLPADNGVSLLGPDRDDAQKGVESLRKAYVKIQEVLDRYSNESIFGNMTRAPIAGLTIGQLERRANQLMDDLNRGKPLELNFDKGLSKRRAVGERVRLSNKTDRINQAKIDAGFSLTRALKSIADAKAQLAEHEKFLNPNNDNEPPAPSGPPAMPPPDIPPSAPESLVNEGSIQLRTPAEVLIDLKNTYGDPGQFPRAARYVRNDLEKELYEAAGLTIPPQDSVETSEAEFRKEVSLRDRLDQLLLRLLKQPPNILNNLFIQNSPQLQAAFRGYSDAYQAAQQADKSNNVELNAKRSQAKDEFIGQLDREGDINWEEQPRLTAEARRGYDRFQSLLQHAPDISNEDLVNAISAKNRFNITATRYDSDRISQRLDFLLSAAKQTGINLE